MATTLSQVLTETQEAKDTVTSFLRQYEVGNLLRQCRAHKIKGFPVLQIFIYLLGCMFSPISTYMSMKIDTYKEPFSKNTIYRFCNDAGINWHKFCVSCQSVSSDNSFAQLHQTRELNTSS